MPFHGSIITSFGTLLFYEAGFAVKCLMWMGWDGMGWYFGVVVRQADLFAIPSASGASVHQYIDV